MKQQAGTGHRKAAARPAAAVMIALLLAGCAGQRPAPEAIEWLDERTAATLTRVPEPVVFYAEDPALAANARDYLHLAPVTVNRGGVVTRWLWLATWSTIDRGARGNTAAPASITGVQLLVDGEPMEMDMAAARQDVDGLQDAPYALPVDTAVHRYVPVTASQLERIARARTLALATEDGATGSRHWQPWAGDPATLRVFAQLATDPAGPVARVSGATVR